LLDLSSAFDTANYDCLLGVLQNRFSVDSPALEWFQSYLSDRSQMFIPSNSQSDPVLVECSAPQGSVLGPLQFIAYTLKMLLRCSTNTIEAIMFADDKQLYVHVLPGHEVVTGQSTQAGVLHL